MNPSGKPRAPFDPILSRLDFPILSRRINGKPLVYLDNAATTQKPMSVIMSMTAYYERTNANVHRGVHTLSQEATSSDGRIPGSGGPVYRRGRSGHDHFYPQCHRVHQPRGLRLGPQGSETGATKFC
jgi:hypothetical protein